MMEHVTSPQIPATLIERTRGLALRHSSELWPERHAPGDAGLPMLVVDNALGRAILSPHGAHVMSFQPAGGREMLWLSPLTAFRAGTPVRGGIPLCLPWFGPGPDGKRMHGFARTSEWTLAAADATAAGETRIVMTLAGDEAVCDLWPHDFAFCFEALVGARLTLGITVENRGRRAAPLSFAFHTYFAVPNVADIRIGGLDGTTYIDKLDQRTLQARKQQLGEVRISGQTDRIYLDVPAQQTLTTPAGLTRIESDARCAVVWNAGDNDRNMPDLGAGNHVGYVCVERGDMADHAVTLAPGERYRRWMILQN